MRGHIHGMRQRKDNETDLPPEPPERTSPDNTLILGLLTLQNSETITLCCLERLCLWYKANVFTDTLSWHHRTKLFKTEGSME